MTHLSPRSPESSSWIWLSLIPVFGGLAIANAGKRANNKSWISVGLAFTATSLILHAQSVFVVIWFAQIGMGLYIRQQINSQQLIAANKTRKNYPNLSQNREKIDINTCSKNDLVYQLGLPIVYANDIDSVRHEGYIFTHLEELHTIAGLPENYLKQLEPLIIFTYDIHKEIDTSWRSLNHYSAREFISIGIEESVANKIVAEREKNGLYRSAIEVRNRTGIPLKYYQQLF